MRKFHVLFTQASQILFTSKLHPIMVPQTLSKGA